MAEITINSPAEIRQTKEDSRTGFVSLIIFLSVAALEITFIFVALFTVSSLPSGSDNTFQFTRNAAIILTAGQVLHGVGVLVATRGLFGRIHRRRLAGLGVLANLIPIALFWLS